MLVRPRLPRSLQRLGLITTLCCTLGYPSAASADAAKEATSKATATLAHNLKASQSAAQRLAALDAIKAAQTAAPSYQANLADALGEAAHAPDPESRTRAAEALALMATAKGPGGRDKLVQLIGEEDDWSIYRGALSGPCSGPATAFVDLVAALRQSQVLNTGEKHRLRSRRALVLCLLTRQAGTPAPDEKTFLVLGPDAERKSVSDEGLTAIGAAYNLAAKGKEGADQALALMVGHSGADQKALRLVAANALGGTGVNPEGDMVDQLAKLIDAESDSEARSEELIAMATLAEVSPAAFARIKDYLLNTEDCNFAQRLALTVPSHDVRLVLFKKLGGKGGGRSSALRAWLQTRTFQPCGSAAGKAHHKAPKG